MPARSQAVNWLNSVGVNSIEAAGPGHGSNTSWPPTVPGCRVLPGRSRLTETVNVGLFRPTHGLWHTADYAPNRRRPDASWLSTVVPTIQALLDQGEATRGFTVKVRGGHLILGRVDELGPISASD